jgi:hypothetical protein
MKTDLANKFTRAFHRTSFKIKKHSPEILIVAGVIGTVTSAVMACKATTKAGAILEKTKLELNDINDVAADVEAGIIPAKEYTPEDHKKDLVGVYARTGIDFVKLYAPSVILGTLSLTAIISSHNILRKRNIGLAAAYAAVDKGFKEYRGRVIERFGKEMDRELKYNIKAKEIIETEVDENGKEKQVKKTIDVMDPTAYSPYSIVFDDGNTGWDDDPELSKFFLIQQQNQANNLLKAQGHLFLNEVYDLIGAKRTRAGNVVGWVYDEKNPVGDNYVDFGIFDITRPKARDFVNGYEKVIVLDFNVDGDIQDLVF